MTDDRMALADLIEKDADIDLVREMFALDDARLMEVEVEEVTGRRSGPERRPERRIATFTRSADGSRGSGGIDLAITKLSRGACFPSFLDPRRTAEIDERVSVLLRRLREVSWPSL
jgi:hypothetical protein